MKDEDQERFDHCDKCGLHHFLHLSCEPEDKQRFIENPFHEFDRKPNITNPMTSSRQKIEIDYYKEG